VNVAPRSVIVLPIAEGSRLNQRSHWISEIHRNRSRLAIVICRDHAAGHGLHFQGLEEGTIDEVEVLHDVMLAFGLDRDVTRRSSGRSG